MFMSGLDPSDEVLYQITMPMSTETEPISNDTYPWSDELSNKLLFEVATQLSN